MLWSTVKGCVIDTAHELAVETESDSADTSAARDAVAELTFWLDQTDLLEAWSDPRRTDTASR